MMHCKQCHSKEIIRNGCVRGVQRYKCNECRLNFVEGDRRQKPQTAVKKALCVILCLARFLITHPPLSTGGL